MKGPLEPSCYRVLVVDDDPTIHAVMRKLLDNLSLVQQTSVAVESAMHGYAAIETADSALREHRPFALAFVDLRMPESIDGIETIARLWERDADLQTVILSAASDDAWPEVIERLGESDRLLIVKKPLQCEVVRQTTCAMLSKWSLGREVRRQLAEQSTESKQMRLILETAHDAYLSLDGSGRIRDWNAQALKLLAQSPECLFDLPIGRVLTAPTADAKPLSDLLTTLAQQDRGTRMELAAHTADGVVIPVEASIAPMRIHATLTFNVFLHDIRGRRRMQSQLRQTEQLRSVGHLAAGLAHEINTPIQFVADNTQFLKDAFGEMTAVFATMEQLVQCVQLDGAPATQLASLAYFADEVPRAIAESLEGIERVAKTVRAIRDLAHPGHRDRKPIDLNATIESFLATFRETCPQRIRVDAVLHSQLPPVPCHAGELQQVLQQLLSNAVHAIEDAPASSPAWIGVSTQLDEGWAELRVSDTGCGIAPEHCDRIFDAYFTTKAMQRGLGQGLAICQAIVVAGHQGTIDFDSTLGVGTTFIVRFPLVVPNQSTRSDVDSSFADQYEFSERYV